MVKKTTFERHFIIFYNHLNLKFRCRHFANIRIYTDKTLLVRQFETKKKKTPDNFIIIYLAVTIIVFIFCRYKWNSGLPTKLNKQRSLSQCWLPVYRRWLPPIGAESWNSEHEYKVARWFPVLKTEIVLVEFLSLMFFFFFWINSFVSII